MELIKALLALITSFFNKSTVQTQKEVKLADAQTEAVINEIKATENVKAVQQQEEVQEVLEVVQKRQQEEKHEEAKKPLDVQLDDMFMNDN